MYAGSTLTRASGRFLGAHQKIDKLAHKQLDQLIEVKYPNLKSGNFPAMRQILHFEGGNGPDAIKRKSPAKDEPWHYFQPENKSDTELIEIIDSHYRRLVASLKIKDEVRSAFEAAWLAHAIVDGLTPAHHYPYGQKVVELRGGQGLESRVSVKEKLLMPGKNLIELAHNNWKFWGPKGLFMTHAAFEIGFATLIKPLRSCGLRLVDCEPDRINAASLAGWYRKVALSITDLHLYDRFYKQGWTRQLAKDARKTLFPVLVKTVALTWFAAVCEASKDE
jgi:hypothetical protein